VSQVLLPDPAIITLIVRAKKIDGTRKLEEKTLGLVSRQEAGSPGEKPHRFIEITRQNWSGFQH